jgi:hypothetical protein
VSDGARSAPTARRHIKAPHVKQQAQAGQQRVVNYHLDHPSLIRPGPQLTFMILISQTVVGGLHLASRACQAANIAFFNFSECRFTQILMR